MLNYLVSLSKIKKIKIITDKNRLNQLMLTFKLKYQSFKNILAGSLRLNLKKQCLTY